MLHQNRFPTVKGMTLRKGQTLVLLLAVLGTATLLVATACASAAPTSSRPAPTASSKSSSYSTPVTSPATNVSSADEVLFMQDRMLVRTVNVELVVVSVRDVLDKIEALTRQYGGWIVSTDSAFGSDNDQRGRISIRVPSERLNEALRDLRSFGERVAIEKQDSTDVTEEYVDLESRLRNLEEVELQMVAILNRAQTIDETLRVQNYVTSIRSDIEKMKGRMNQLERTSSMSLINVTLTPKVAPQPIVKEGLSLVESAKSAFRAFVTTGQVLAVIAVWLLLFSPIWGTLAAVGIYLGRRASRAKRPGNPG